MELSTTTSPFANHQPRSVPDWTQIPPVQVRLFMTLPPRTIEVVTYFLTKKYNYRSTAERLRGEVLMTRRYANRCLPLPLHAKHSISDQYLAFYPPKNLHLNIILNESINHTVICDELEAQTK